MHTIVIIRHKGLKEFSKCSDPTALHTIQLETGEHICHAKV